MFSCAYFNKFPGSVVPSDWEGLDLRGPWHYMLLCLKIETDLASETLCLFKKIGMHSQKKEKTMSVNSVMLCSHISLHMMIWWCKHWFGSTWSSSEQSGLAQTHLSLCMQNWDDLIYLSTKFKEKILSCIWVNMVLILGEMLTNSQVTNTRRCQFFKLYNWTEPVMLSIG
jgi:hypothetical protein